ncbi:MAG: hypothetical protein WD738_17025 [Pirellulales bacterium]
MSKKSSVASRFATATILVGVLATSSAQAVTKILYISDRAAHRVLAYDVSDAMAPAFMGEYPNGGYTTWTAIEYDDETKKLFAAVRHGPGLDIEEGAVVTLDVSDPMDFSVQPVLTISNPRYPDVREAHGLAIDESFVYTSWGNLLTNQTITKHAKTGGAPIIDMPVGPVMPNTCPAGAMCIPGGMGIASDGDILHANSANEYIQKFDAETFELTAVGSVVSAETPKLHYAQQVAANPVTGAIQSLSSCRFGCNADPAIPGDPQVGGGVVQYELVGAELINQGYFGDADTDVWPSIQLPGRFPFGMTFDPTNGWLYAGGANDSFSDIAVFDEMGVLQTVFATDVFANGRDGLAFRVIEEGLPGDFNENGKVDAADYVVWRKNNNTNNSLPNDSGLGTPIGSAHFDLWRANFGMMAAGAAAGSNAPVPEPASLVVLGLAGPLLLAARVARRQNT